MFATQRLQYGAYEAETHRPTIDAENNTAAFFDSIEEPSDQAD